MIKLKTNGSVMDLDNKPIPDLTVGKAIASMVLASKNDPLRAFLMATDLVKKDTVELSPADFDWIKTCVTNHGKDVYTNSLVPGQMLYLLSELKDDKK